MNYYSFDVFDTCLCRLCGESRLLFDVLSLKVQHAMGQRCNEHLRQLFVTARVNAGGKDLSEIYNNVAKSFPIPYTVEQMVELEIETEREMLVPVVATRELVNRLRAKGKVMFISDMYLPSSFIQERLAEFGFFKEGDLLFVSDELQAWKFDGSLYRLVHEKEGVSYRRWYHYGDNWHSDVKMPRRLGIHAHHIHFDYLPFEEQWRKKSVLQFQYSAILAGVARAVRLSTKAPEDQKAFVCDISAPLMVSWVKYIMDDAQSRGVKRLYFCARDVHTEYLIARWLEQFYTDLEARYFFVSMKAMESDADILCEYLTQEGILSTESVALVDSNSSGNTLIRINSIANLKHLHPVQGYYISDWNPNKLLVPTLEDLNGMHYLNFSKYSKNMASPQIRRLSGMRIVYELILSVNYHKRSVGYEHHGSKMRPVFETDTEDNWHIEGADVRQIKRDNDRMALAFAKALDVTRLSGSSKEILFQIVIPALAEFFDRPNKTYLCFLHRFIFWDKPFVGSIRGKNKGVWKRGSLFYRMPSILAAPFRAILADTNLRHQINHSLAWIKRK